MINDHLFAFHQSTSPSLGNPDFTYEIRHYSQTCTNIVIIFAYEFQLVIFLTIICILNCDWSLLFCIYLSSVILCVGWHTEILVVRHTSDAAALCLCVWGVCVNLKCVMVQLCIADYFEDADNEEAKRLFEEIVNNLQVKSLPRNTVHLILLMSQIYTNQILNSLTLLKINVLYWHWWFHKEPSTSLESFHSMKVF